MINVSRRKKNMHGTYSTCFRSLSRLMRQSSPEKTYTKKHRTFALDSWKGKIQQLQDVWPSAQEYILLGKFQPINTKPAQPPWINLTKALLGATSQPRVKKPDSPLWKLTYPLKLMVGRWHVPFTIFRILLNFMVKIDPPKLMVLKIDGSS